MEISRTGTTSVEHLYRGERFDANAGFYDLRARLYSPSNGRFLTQDSFAGFGSDPRSLHKYVYANGDPVNGRDPSGYFTLMELGVAQDIRSMLGEMQTDVGFSIIDAALNRDSYDASSMGWSAAMSMIPGAVIGKAAGLFKKVKFVRNSKAGRGWVKALDGASENEIKVAEIMADKMGATVYVRGNSNIGKKINDLWIGGKRWELKQFNVLLQTSVSRNILEGSQQARRVLPDARAPSNGFDHGTLTRGVGAAIENSAKYGRPMPSEVWALIPGDELIQIWPR